MKYNCNENCGLIGICDENIMSILILCSKLLTCFRINIVKNCIFVTILV